MTLGCFRPILGVGVLRVVKGSSLGCQKVIPGITFGPKLMQGMIPRKLLFLLGIIPRLNITKSENTGIIPLKTVKTRGRSLRLVKIFGMIPVSPGIIPSITGMIPVTARMIPLTRGSSLRVRDHPCESGDDPCTSGDHPF